jgi:hypothetical protein
MGTAMLVSKLSCPKCKTVLRPAKPLPAGKKVKCPKCSNDFTAEEGNADKASVMDVALEAAATLPPKKPDKPPPKKIGPKKPGAEEEEDSGGVYGIAAADRPKTAEDLADEDDDDDDDDGKVDFIPDYAMKDLRGPAQAAVVRPSNYLLACGVVGFFGWVILLIMMLLPVIFPVLDDEDDTNKKDAPAKPTLIIPDGLSTLAGGNPRGGGPGGGARPVPQPTKAAPKPEKKKATIYLVYTYDLSTLSQYPWYLFIVMLSPIFFGIVYSCVQTYGAVKMQSLESRVWGIVASCMCLFPYSTWGLVTVFSMVITLAVGFLADEKETALIFLIGFFVLETLVCVAIGAVGLMTLMRQDVIDGYEYVPDL